MQSVNRIIKFLWVFSLLILVSGILYGYYILPDAVCYKFDSKGNPLDYIPRNTAFYFFIASVGIFNVFILLIERLLLMIPDRMKPVPNKSFWLENSTNKEALNYALSDWFYSFGAVINGGFLIFYYAFAKVNSDFQSSINQYFWVFQLIGIVIVLWVLYLPFRLYTSKIFIR